MRDENGWSEEKVSKQIIWVSILIPSEPMTGMVVKIWNFGGLPTQPVTAANHI
jgi:hypothetical protein